MRKYVAMRDCTWVLLLFMELFQLAAGVNVIGTLVCTHFGIHTVLCCCGLAKLKLLRY